MQAIEVDGAVMTAPTVAPVGPFRGATLTGPTGGTFTAIQARSLAAVPSYGPLPVPLTPTA